MLRQKFKRNTFIIFVALIQVTSITAYGQNKKMLIEQIAGKRIVRQNFDRNGDLQSKQIFLTGELEQVDKNFRIEVITELYDERGQFIEKYSTSYQCNPKEYDVLLNVFPFTDPSDEKIKVEVTSKDFQQLYELGQNKELEDIHLKMTVESGALSFFGSKSLLTLRNRKMEITDQSVKITGEAVVKIYMIGIRVKMINYIIEENLNEDFVLQRQKFTKDDGAWFTMIYDSAY